MKAQAQDIIRGATEALQDDGVRWAVDRLVRYLNDGQRQIVEAHPQETATTVTFTADPGGRQVLPPQAQSLLEVRRNSDGRLTALTRVDRHLLEAVDPEWEAARPRLPIVHYMVNPLEPRVFYLYRPAEGGEELELTYSRYPQDVPAPSGSGLSDVSGSTDLELRWANALRDYVLYRACIWDAEAAGTAELAQHYQAAFVAQVGAAPTG